MDNGKSFDQFRADIIKDIDDVRSGKLAASVATVIFQGVKELTRTVDTEIAAARLCLLTQWKAREFGKVVRMGRRKLTGDE